MPTIGNGELPSDFFPVSPIHFVSSNEDKVREVSRLLSIDLIPVSLEIRETQASSLEEITRDKLETARDVVSGRVIVEDVGLGFVALGGFPGPYVKWLLESTGAQGLGNIARGLSDRSAIAGCCVGYWDGATTRMFLGEAMGEILVEPRGDGNFGWDPWFRPEDSAKTFAEMDEIEKGAISHRGKAYRALQSHFNLL